MSPPRYLVENFFNVVMFPNHTVRGSSETVKYEAWRVGTARRSVRNYWTPATTGNAYLEVICDRPRFADMLVLDRNHNLSGTTIQVTASNDGFGTFTTVFNGKVPSRVVYGSRLTTPGARTEEGAFLVKFRGQVARDWKVTFSDLGSAKAQVGGLYLGKSFSPVWTPPIPWDDENGELRFSETVSDSFWAGTNRKASRRLLGPWVHDLDSDSEYSEARYHFHGLYWRGNFMWVVPDQDQAERAGLFYALPGQFGAPYPADFPQRRLVLTGAEHEPLQ